jgi:hypothetical protein
MIISEAEHRQEKAGSVEKIIGATPGSGFLVFRTVDIFNKDRCRVAPTAR